jgi:hypothetical protein
VLVDPIESDSDVDEVDGESSIRLMFSGLGFGFDSSCTVTTVS